MASMIGCKLGSRLRGNVVFLGFFGMKNFYEKAIVGQDGFAF